MGRDTGDEIERRLGHGKCVAGVEADSDAARRFAEFRKFVAAEILMVLDRQNSAFVGRARATVGERGADLGDQLLPFLAKRVTIAAQDRRQAMADDLGVENAGRAQRALERAHHQPRADDRSHAQGREPVAQRAELIVAQRP